MRLPLCLSENAQKCVGRIRFFDARPCARPPQPLKTAGAGPEMPPWLHATAAWSGERHAAGWPRCAGPVRWPWRAVDRQTPRETPGPRYWTALGMRLILMSCWGHPEAPSGAVRRAQYGHWNLIVGQRVLASDLSLVDFVRCLKALLVRIQHVFQHHQDFSR